MKTIASRQNPLFKRVRAAIREHGPEIVIEGPKQVAHPVRELLDAGLPLFAADAHGTSAAPPARAAVLVFGSEGTGASAELLGHSTPIAIAPSDRIDSLNVAASAAVLLSRSFAARSRLGDP